MRSTVVSAAVLVVGLALTQPAGASPPLELRKGDHICLIGNALAERMQHSSWLETLIYARSPQHNLVFRNLGYGGDEVKGYRDLYSRMRSMDFGSQDQWLAGDAPIPQPAKLNPGAPVRPNRFEFTNTRADVIFAFYGYNESFADAAGLQKFKEDLRRFIKHTLAQRVQRKVSPATGAVLPDRPRESGRSQSSGRRREQSAAQTLYGGHGRGRPGGKRLLCRSVHADACAAFPTRWPQAHDRRHPFERRGGSLRRGRGLSGALRRSAPVRRSAACELAGRDQPKELVLVSPLSHAGRLFDLRRPRVPAIRRRTNELRSLAARVGDHRPDDVEPRQGGLGGRARPCDQTRRFESARFHPRRHQQAGAVAGRQARLSERRRRNQKDDRPQGNEGHPLRLRRTVPRAGEPRADGFRHAGPPVGLRLAQLSALETEGRGRRQAVDS